MKKRVTVTIALAFYYLVACAGLVVMVSAQEEETCQPCANGQDPTFAENENDDKDDQTCRENIQATTQLAANSRQCHLHQLANFQESCCDEPPRGVCTICPDGSSFDATTVVPNFRPGAGDRTCADLNADENFLDYIFKSGTCEDTLLQRSGAWCGCPGAEQKCSLCPDGSRPPDPTLVDPVYYGWDCDSFDFMAASFNEEECANFVNDILEFDAPSFCGCPDSPVPNVCALCPHGGEVTRPNLRLGSGTFTCQELAVSTKYIPKITTCIEALTTYRGKGYVDACCSSSSRGVSSRSFLLVILISFVVTIFVKVWRRRRTSMQNQEILDCPEEDEVEEGVEEEDKAVVESRLID